ncbi:MAG: sugar phosphate nucleotidyltransferase [Bacteroidota bacterium]
MKAVIPVAGVGTKLRPHTHTQPKPLIPVAGKPILGHIIDNLLKAGVRKQIFIIGYLREKVQEYVETHYADKIEMEFVVQEPRKGLGHALWMCTERIEKEEEILVVLGDTIFGNDTEKVLAMEGAVLAVQEVDRPGEFGVAVLDKEGFVRKLTEKPNIPTSNLALVGMYKINQIPTLLEILDKRVTQGIREEDEYPLTEALQSMVERGIKLRTLAVNDWFDCGRSETLLQANRILLERETNLPTHDFPNAVIIPPVWISEGCVIENSIVGPYVAIAENTHLNNSIVSDSILGAYARLESITLNKSVIGNDTLLRGKANSINIGDNTEIDFSD